MIRIKNTFRHNGIGPAFDDHSPSCSTWSIQLPYWFSSLEKSSAEGCCKLLFVWLAKMSIQNLKTNNLYRAKNVELTKRSSFWEQGSRWKVASHCSSVTVLSRASRFLRCATADGSCHAPSLWLLQ